MRVVLDTNTLISAFLFTGTASQLVQLWQSRRVRPLISKPILEEYLRVLAYPKFRLSDDQIRTLIEQELLPFVGTVRIKKHLTVVRDPDDNMFLECAVEGGSRLLVSGDLDLRSLREYQRVRI